MTHTKSSLQASGFSVECLGAFRKLPPEVRYSIWGHLMPVGQRVVGDPMKFKETKGIFKNWFDLRFDGNGRGLVGMLQASRQLYVEISSQLYHRRELCFQFSTDEPPPGLMTWPLRELPGAFRGHFLFANFARFSRIVFEIEIPTSLDWGGPIDLRSRIRNVIETISDQQQCFIGVCPRAYGSYPPRSANLLEINILFTEVACTCLSTRGSDRHICGQSDICKRVVDSLVSHLCCFQTLRRSKGVTIKLPEMLRDEKLLMTVAESTQRVMQSNASVPMIRKGRCNTLFCNFSKIAEEEGKPPLRYQKWRRWYLVRLRQTLGLKSCYPWPGYSIGDESESTLEERPGMTVDPWGNAVPELSGFQPREVWNI